MKKLVAFLCIVMCLAVLPLSSSAVYYNLIENDPITLPKASPVIDGVINENEGWSDSGWLNYDTHSGAWGVNPLTGTVEFKLAYTEQGVYLAVIIEEVGSAYMVRYYDADGNTEYDASYMDPNAGSYTNEPGGYPSHTPDGTPIEYYLIDNNTTSAPAGVIPKNCFTYTFTGNSFQLCSGEDDIDGEYGFNGDTIGFCIDLLGAWEYEGFLGNTDYIPMYNLGLFEDGSVRVARSHYNNGDITEQCTTAGVQTDNGAVMEVMIPWDIIIEDQNDYGAIFGLQTVFTLEDVIAEGAVHRATINWQDRFYDSEAETIDTWSRFITTCRTTAAGTSGHELDVASFGLKLHMGPEYTGNVAPDTTTTSDTTTTPTPDTDPVSDDTTTGVVTETVVVTDEKGDNVTDDKGNTVTEVVTKKPTNTTKTPTTNKTNTSSNNNSSAAQTFDAGIAVATGLLAVAGVGIVYIKKRK